MASATAGLAALAMTLAVASCSPATTRSSTGPTHGSVIQGGTASFAEGASAPPTFIFPFVNGPNSGINNLTWFQYLMYRPMYFFGVGDTPDLNTALSLAYPPAYSRDRTSATVTLKPYRWSDGESVDAQDVLFWMNMLHANKNNWAFYVPGTFPDNVRSARADSPTQLTFTFDRAYNEKWMTYNELSQITPLPKAWDVTSLHAEPGSGGCFGKVYGTADAACTAVYDFLSTQSGFNPKSPVSPAAAPTTFASNPLWQVVDGPWRLASLDLGGNVTMDRNPSYSGPVKPTLAHFKELAYTSDVAEYYALRSGAVDVGYLPLQFAPPATKLLRPSHNDPKLTGYEIDPVAPWGVAYYSYNFESTGDGGAAGSIFSQLYFRQAMQRLVDQPLYAQRLLNGYGLPSYGPVPVVVSGKSSVSLDQANPFPYSVADARALLSGHGWKVVPGGTSTCVRPGTGTGRCGVGIPADAALQFELEYPSGDTAVESLTGVERSSWAQAGIAVSLRPEANATLQTNTTPCHRGPSCTWELVSNGWLYSPDYYPTGEQLFATGSSSNAGNYSDPANDSNIRATYQSNVSLDHYSNYLANHLPVIWQPINAAFLFEIKDSLRGALSRSVLGVLTPEDWAFVRR